jgi:hypothetical protein
VTGANFKDYRLIDSRVDIRLSDPAVNLPATLWAGEVEAFDADVIGRHQGRAAATRHRMERGEAVFIPSMVGLGAWHFGNQPLADFLAHEYTDLIDQVPVRFVHKQEDAILQTLKSGDEYVVMVTNGRMEPMAAQLMVRNDLEGAVLWGEEAAYKNERVELGPRETVVLHFTP